MDQRRRWLIQLILVCLIAMPMASSQGAFKDTSDPNDNLLNRTITIVGKNFILNGSKALHIISGEFHYFRTPAAYWTELLTKLKLAGLNAVSTYVDWSFHEPEEREYVFSGDRDVAQFIRTAAEVGLYVLLRPGPYICAERDLGGLPYWLLGKYRQIMLRSLDKDYMSETTKWFKKLFEQLSPLLYGNGGPIILVQVENEIGSYANRAYMTSITELISSQVENNAILYTVDPPSMVQNGFLSNSSFAAVKFGPGTNNVSKVFKELSKGGGPLMNAELYTGSFSKWGQPLARGDTDALLQTFKECLTYGVHVNFYMFFGGTNFEFTPGAFSSKDQKAFTPQITSYDYDAPLDEAGNPTKKYFAIRQVLENYFPEVKSLPLPVVRERGSYGKVAMKPKIGLLSRQGRSILSTLSTVYRGGILPTFEDLRQRSGLVLYEINITSKQSEGTYLSEYQNKSAVNRLKILHIEKPRDYIHIFVNGFKSGNISRINSKHHAKFASYKNFALSLLVENQGRIHNMKMYDIDRKGILSKVRLNHGILQGNWTVTGFNLENLNVRGLDNFETNNSESLNAIRGPVLYEGTFKLMQTRSTFLNTKGWGKGIVWINGHNLGRYWPSAGPQVTLFVPGVWLKAAPEKNLVQMLELERPFKQLSVEFVPNPKYYNNRKIDIYKGINRLRKGS